MPRFSELLDGDHVIACGIAEFKQHVVAEAIASGGYDADKPQGDRYSSTMTRPMARSRPR
jgi:hypothetical protein